MQFLKRLFRRDDAPQPDPLRGAITEEQRLEEGRAQRETRAIMEAEVARDRERRGLSDPPPPATGA